MGGEKEKQNWRRGEMRREEKEAGRREGRRAKKGQRVEEEWTEAEVSFSSVTVL